MSRLSGADPNDPFTRAGVLRPRVARALAAACFAIAALGSASCAKSSPTTPSTTQTAATPTVTETFRGTLPVGGSKFYSFSQAVYGTVNATLVSIGGTDVPASVVVSLGIGSPSGTACVGSTSQVQVTGDAGLTTLVTATKDPGLSCVVLTDSGNLFAPATFTITIDHP